MNNGWVKLHRKGLGCWQFQKPEYWVLWCYFLMRAAHKPIEVLYRGKVHELQRGQLATSIRQAAKDCHVGAKVVRNFLDLAMRHSDISAHTTAQSHTVLTICNYERYQAPETTAGHSLGHSGGTVRAQEQERKKVRRTTTMSSGARRVLEFLNEQTGRNFHFVPANLSLITARLEEARQAKISDPELLAKKIIARKYVEARDPDELFNMKYLRPATLFAKTNFWNYAGEVPDHD